MLARKPYRVALIASAVGLCACERAAPAPSAPTPTPVETATVAPPPPVPAPRPITVPPPRVAPVGMARPAPAAVTDPNAPPGDEPVAYAAWLAKRSPAERRAIAALCRKDPTGYEAKCGGIGPLHIPYPPMMRARAHQPGDLTSRFATMEDWQRALSPAQRAYVAAHCPGGEDQPSSALCGDNTPLVVAFTAGPVAFTESGAATFAFAPGVPAASDWPTAETPWLALDRDGDGAITSGAELFGSHTAGGAYAHGFAALAELDVNHDGVLDAADPAFARLLLWADRDGDRRSSPAELTPLSAVIDALPLSYTLDPRCDARDNCEGERAALTWRDAAGARHAGALIDVYVPLRPIR